MDQVNRKAAEMALGRIFGMMQRQDRSNDLVEYERCKSIFLDAIGVTEMPIINNHNFARDYRQILMSGDCL